MVKVRGMEGYGDLILNEGKIILFNLSLQILKGHLTHLALSHLVIISKVQHTFNFIHVI